MCVHIRERHQALKLVLHRHHSLPRSISPATANPRARYFFIEMPGPEDGVADFCLRLQKASTLLGSVTDHLANHTSSDVCCSFCSDICTPSFQATCQPSSPVPSVTSQHVHEKPSHLEIWSYGLAAVFVVCSCAALGLCFYPIMKKKFFHHVLTWMVGLGIGCLSGIAVFQLMPQAMEMPAESPMEIEQYLRKCLVIVCAIYSFYIAERVFKMAVAHRQKNNSRPTTSSTVPEDPDTDVVQTLMLPLPAVLPKDSIQSVVTVDDSAESSCSSHPYSHDTIRKRSKDHIHFHGDTSSQPLKTVAWLILTADSIVDGLSIGAAFSASTMEGITISVAVLCEELPHELGDLAILLNSGLNLKQAVLYNTISGVTCFLGFGVGVFLGELPTARVWIFAVAAGMFLYISFANILPEMVATVEEACQTSMKNGVVVLGLQVCGIAFGVCSMYFLATYADQIRIF